MDQSAARIVGTPTHADASPSQPPPVEGYNPYAADRALQKAVRHAGADWAEAWLAEFGERLGRPETIALGAAANRNPPVLHTHDRFGNRRDEVEFHPPYHQLMTLGFDAGLHCSPWAEPHAGAHAARAAAYILYGQVESGTHCPMTMTYASIPVFAKHAGSLPAMTDVWLPRLPARRYDARFAPIRSKAGASIGMGMTEKQGGSDVRSNTSRADRAGGDGAYRITGHKWFFSAPMCDAFLVLAQAPDGLTCFFLPRHLDDGARNALQLVRLKDQLGNRSNASAEVEFDQAAAVDAQRAGGSGTRVRSGHRARAAAGVRVRPHRSARAGAAPAADAGGEILDLQAARAICAGSEGSARRQRLRRGIDHAAHLPRGAGQLDLGRLGNVMCLDVMRAATRNGESVAALFDELDAARGGDARLDTFVAQLARDLDDPATRGPVARRLTEGIALALQAALLVRHAPNEVADAFCASRLAADAGACFGTLPAATAFARIIDRTWPST